MVDKKFLLSRDLNQEPRGHEQELLPRRNTGNKKFIVEIITQANKQQTHLGILF